MAAILIYGLVDPRKPEDIRYVGKTRQRISRRLYGHITQAKNGNRTHKSAWIRRLIADNVLPVVVILEETTTENWAMAEKAWIKTLKDNGHDLTNATDGGEGGATSIGRSPSEETRNKIRLANTGRKHSDETRAKLSASRKRQVFSEETRAKISAANLGHGASNEARTKMSVASKGKPKSEEHKQKMREGWAKRRASLQNV